MTSRAGPSAAASTPNPTQTTNLASLISSSPASGTRIYPSPDALLTTLHARSRGDLPYTAIGERVCVVINPLRGLASAGDEAARRAVDRARRVSEDGEVDEGQPGPYEVAGRVWSLMRRRGEDQAVVYSGPTHSGKTYTSRLFTTQLLRLSASSPGPNGTFRYTRPALQFQALHTVLDAFGHAKTSASADASQHGRYLELAFRAGSGQFAGAQVLAFGLDKSRVVRLEREERSFHVFYQLLAGASPAERDAHGLLDPAEYALLASSGTYRLPGGPASDDAVQFDELRAALACLGFKSKHLQSIFNVLSCILLLGNVRFADAFSGLGDESCAVDAESRPIVDDVARRLGVDAADLEGALTNETRWVRGSAGARKEVCSVVLDARGAERQRDSLVRDIYAILFAFVVETGNRKVAPQPAEGGALHTIAQLDIPGYRSRSQAPADPRASQYSQTLITTQGENGVDEFCVNFANELVHAYVTRRAFDDEGDAFAARVVQDGIALPRVIPLDNASCVELLRGGLVGDNTLGARPGGLCGLLEAVSGKSHGKETADEAVRRDSRLVDDMIRAFGVQGSLFVAGGATRTNQARTSFGINHYSGPITYDAKDFVDSNTDVLDAQFVGLLRTSTDTFVSKLVSGPAIAAESHPMDESTIVQAQVAVVPLRDPAGLNGAAEVQLTSLLEQGVAHPLSTQYNATMSMLLNTLDSARLWQFICIRPNESGYPGSFDKRRVKHQITASLLPDLVARCQTDFVADLDLEEFCGLHGLRLGSSPADSVRDFAQRQGWTEGQHYSVGQSRIWFTYVGWRMADDIVRRRLGDSGTPNVEPEMDTPRSAALHSDAYSDAQSRRSVYRGQEDTYGESVEDLLIRRVDTRGSENVSAAPGRGFGGYERPPMGMHDNPSATWDSEYDHKSIGHAAPPVLAATYPPEKMPMHAEDLSAKEAEAAGMVVPSKHKTEVEMVPTTRARRWWVRITWLLTWWMPSFLLSWIGRMKRPDIRMAWREKLAIFMMIIFMCGVVIFYIVIFGKLLCPNSDKAWNTSELAQHAGTDDYYAAVAGKVYDFTKFYKIQHSDITAYPTTSSIMLEFAGQDLTDYFPVPFTVACPGLVTSTALYMQRANFTPIVSYAVHTSGPLQTVNGTKLDDINWYYDRFTPYVEQYYKGQFVWDKNDIQSQADDSSKFWAIYKNNLYDLSDYFATIDYYKTSSGEGVPNYAFLNSGLTDLFKQQPGTDITKDMDQVFSSMTSEEVQQQMTCLNNAFYLGVTDFRKTARCTVQNYLLLAFSILLMSTIFAKFLAALQLGSKRQPELLDKFVICQVPCYTEGEESLRRTIDSLAALRYDDKRKLMFIICDGNIIGSGNDRPTPRIVLDILGVDPKLDPEPLLFKSIGEGAKQLNYGKVYSGLYEFEGHVVPYMVVVKVGKPSERSKPGNRGKRDSQVLLLHYLNRVHFDAPMNPLELEIFHQMRNIIGIDPAFYEYIFQVDADTTVTPDSLNRMIACASDDQKIIGICGETKLANERQSLTTMIQVYEYYISHNLTKAFESLFGSVTCLPGCFSVYRIRTADKGRPIIISSRVIDEYSEPNVDTLHKKNLFSLGEDRYLTTLMMKHFPTFKMKFTPDAIAHTVAPDKWSILLSQRRRWINSTIHNLVELLFLPEMCGFCFFSMRFIVFVDLLGTIILPATCVYLIYLIVVVSTGKAAIPIISIAMIAAVYGLQALIFILRREFMLVGWMIIYILAFPIYSFFLPLYSFWSMDDFSWGSTRLVVGEGNNKKVISDADDHFDDSMIPLKRFSEYEAETWETASAVHSEHTLRDDEKSSVTGSARRNLGRRPPPMSGQTSANNLGDYYRDGSALGPGSNRNLRTIPSSSSLRSGSDVKPAQAPGYRSMAGLSQWGAGSQYGGGMAGIHNPFLGASPAGSAYGGAEGHMGSQAALNNPYGMMGAPRNSMMPMMSDFNGSNPFMGGGMQQSPAARPQTLNPRISTFSFATTANPFAGAAPPAPSSDPNPSDDDIVRMVSDYLATKDLMTVTKRKVREGVMALFPEADLSDKTTLINESIDRLLTA